MILESNDIKYVLLDLTNLEFLNETPALLLESGPNRELVPLQVLSNHLSLSGTSYIPDDIYNTYRSGGNLYKISMSGSNLSILDGNDTIVNPGFLSTSGGILQGDLFLYQDPTYDLGAATKHYVDTAISGSAVSGVIADAISSLLQVDLALGTDLTVVNNAIPLAAITAIINGDDYIVSGNQFVIKYPGLYQMSWNIVGNLVGIPIRRRNLVADLNLNNGSSFPVGSLGGNYTRDAGSSPIINVGGDYIIHTTTPNETVSVRTRDLSTEVTTGITFTIAGGYFRVRLVRKEV